MNRPDMLSATFVRTVRTPGRYGDGRGGLGLSLLVRTGSGGRLTRCWTQSVRLDGKPTSTGLGSYPVVTLALARKRALHNARAIAEGREPRRRATRSVPTFAAACETVIAIHAAHWKPGGGNAAQWRNSLRNHVLPTLGARPVDAITGTEVIAVLEPRWTTRRETARRLRRRISAVMQWAIAQGFRADNPAGDAISGALPNNPAKRQHQRALPYAQVGAAIRRVRASSAYRGTVLAFEFLVLTASRSSEVLKADWNEIDREAAVWTVPATRTKAGREHRVPLSDRALGVLDEAHQQLTHGNAAVFPSSTGILQGPTHLSYMLQEFGIDAVPHGFRSSFRDWAAECTDAPRDVCELALAHVNRDRVEAAYMRTDLFERRRVLMQQWADFVAATA